jgi:hypothetical protein
VVSCAVLAGGSVFELETLLSSVETKVRAVPGIRFSENTMTYADRDTYGMYRGSAAAGTGDGPGPGPGLMGADTLIGNDVRNADGDELGEIIEIMLDMRTGQVAYAVLSFGGLLGMGDKLFAVPWSALTLDTMNKRFVLNVEQQRLEDAPGFEKDQWPDMADPAWRDAIRTYYGVRPHHDELRP